MALSRPSSPLKSLGQYDLLQEVGCGSMGTVFKGRNRDTQQIVAVKLMAPDVAGNTTYLKRFEQEFRVASRLDHPNIVRALDYNDAGATPYLVMEFVDGESLGDRLERTGRLSEAEALNIIVQAAEALQVAHDQGLIHRDIKPDNIMVTRDGVVKVTDLGLVKERDATTELTRPGAGLGTPNFMAPEQFKNAKNASVRCDVYSLGATLYQMVTGELPWKGSDVISTMMRKLKNDLPAPRSRVPVLSERTDAAIRRAMDADANQRPASCRAFIDDLISPGRPTAAAPLSRDHDAVAETAVAPVPPSPAPVMPTSAPLADTSASEAKLSNGQTLVLLCLAAAVVAVVFYVLFY